MVVFGGMPSNPMPTHLSWDPAYSFSPSLSDFLINLDVAPPADRARSAFCPPAFTTAPEPYHPFTSSIALYDCVFLPVSSKRFVCIASDVSSLNLTPINRIGCPLRHN